MRLPGEIPRCAGALISLEPGGEAVLSTRAVRGYLNVEGGCPCGTAEPSMWGQHRGQGRKWIELSSSAWSWPCTQGTLKAHFLWVTDHSLSSRSTQPAQGAGGRIKPKLPCFSENLCPSTLSLLSLAVSGSITLCLTSPQQFWENEASMPKPSSHSLPDSPCFYRLPCSIRPDQQPHCTCYQERNLAGEGRGYWLDTR